MNEILLPDWIEASSSKYSVNNLGKVDILTTWEN